MKQDLQRSLIWIAAILASIPSAFAVETLNTALRPVMDLIGPEGIAGLYIGPYALLWDSILALVFFILLVKRVLGEKFGNGVSAVIGIILSIGFVSFEWASGWRLGDLAPLAFFIFLLVIGVAVYEIIAKHSQHRFIAFCAAFVTIWLTAIIMGKLVFTKYFTEHPTTYAVLWAMFIFCAGALLIHGIGKISRGGKEDFSPFGDLSRHRAVKDKLGEDEKKAAGLATDVNSQKAMDAQAALNAELERLKRDAGADVGQDQAMAGADTTIGQEVGGTEQFLEGAEKGLEQLKDAPEGERMAYSQQLEEQAHTLNDYFNHIEGILANEEMALLAPDAVTADDKLLEQHRKNIEQFSIGEISKERELMKDMSATEQVVSNAYNRIQNLSSKAAGVQLPADAKNVVQSSVGSLKQYEQHLDKVRQLKDVFQQAESLAEQSSKLEDKLRKDVDRVQEMRKGAGDRVHQTRAKFKEFRQKAIASLPLRSEEAIRQAEEESKVVEKSILELQQMSADIEKAHSSIAEDTQQLEQLQQKFRPLQQQFTQEVPRLLEEEKLLDAKATAGELVFDVSLAADELSTGKLTGLDKIGLKAFTRQNKGRNIKNITRHIEKKMGGSLDKLAKVDKDEQDTPAGETMTAAYTAASDIKNELVGAWTKYIDQKTEETEKMVKEAAKAGPRGSFKNLPGGSGSK